MNLSTQSAAPRARPPAPCVPDRVVGVVAAVLRHAQSGDLPLFAWTLGYPQHVWMDMLDACFPRLGGLESMSADEYAAIAKTVPTIFPDLAIALFEQRGDAIDERHADWLARAIAAGCLGSRHLWQDLGLKGRNELSEILAEYFPALFARNSRNMKWKRFLVAELLGRRGCTQMLLPNCRGCEDFPVCFPDAPERDAG